MRTIKLFLTILSVLFCFCEISRAQAKSDLSENADQAIENAVPDEGIDKTDDSIAKAPDYEVEKSRSKHLKSCKCEFNVGVPYRERRENFGTLIGFQWGSFAPVNYQPEYSTETFDSYYGGQKNGTMELSIAVNWNFAIGSIGPHISAGVFTATHTDNSGSTPVTTNLSIIPITAGLMYSLNTIFKEPYVVPYVIGGMYTGIYSETLQGLSVKGNSPFAPFYAVGAMFQLDWIDPEAHESGYLDFGLENTFLYIEGRSFLASTSLKPSARSDLSTPLQIFAGLRTEF